MSENGFRMKEVLKIYEKDTGKLLVETYNSDNIFHRIKKALGLGNYAEDLILDGGLADVARMIAERYGYVSVGTGITAPEHDDTELESEVCSRAVAATSLITTFYTEDTAQFSGEFTPPSNYSITESGVHLAASASGDILFARETFAPMTWTAGIIYTVVWQIIIMR